MRIISIPYQIQGGKLVLPLLNWPDRCACCGGPRANSTAFLHHRARIAQEASNSISYYPLAWTVPYCETCISHSKYIIPELPVYLAVFFIWFGLGYLLFLFGLAYNTIAIIAYVVALILLGYGAFVLSRWLNAFQQKRNSRMMTPGCSYIRFAVNVRSSLNDVTFEFHNDAIASEFALLNGFR